MLRDIDANANFILNDIFGVRTISELATVIPAKDQLKNLKKRGINPENLNTWIENSRFIVNIRELEQIPKRKIVVAGLDNSGKTSIINLITDDFGLKVFKEPPVSDVAQGIQKYDLEGPLCNYIIWELGGNEHYREKYFKETSNYFRDIEMLFYVINIQDQVRYEEAFRYLKNITNILKVFKEYPQINILINKFDSDLEQTSYLEMINIIEESLKDYLEGFDYEFYTTSIHDSISPDESVLAEMKSVFKSCSLLDHSEDISEIASLVERLMDIFIKTSVKIEEMSNFFMQKLINFENRLNNLEQKTLSPNESPIKSIEQEMPKTFDRSKINKELKEIFQKKLGRFQ
jgi:GTPase SAR1 family protein